MGSTRSKERSKVYACETSNRKTTEQLFTKDISNRSVLATEPIASNLSDAFNLLILKNGRELMHHIQTQHDLAACSQK